LAASLSFYFFSVGFEVERAILDLHLAHPYPRRSLGKRVQEWGK
jgi:hypothetical protein